MVIKKVMDESTLKKSKINYQNNYQSYLSNTAIQTMNEIK